MALRFFEADMKLAEDEADMKSAEDKVHRTGLRNKSNGSLLRHEIRRASVAYGRQGSGEGYEELDNAASTLTGGTCLGGLFHTLQGKSRGAKVLKYVADITEFRELSESQRRGVAVFVDSKSKENSPGWICQDAHAACALVKPGSDENTLAPLLFCGVFDGHGQYGYDAAHIASTRVPRHLMSALGESQLEYGKAMVKAMREADKDICISLGRGANFSGTTAVGVLVDLEQRLLQIANVGDSGAIVGRASSDRWEAVPITSDARPSSPDERKRIENSGGVVAPHKDGGPMRVWDSTSLMKPGLAVSRSLGDACASHLGVIPEPFLSTHKLSPEDRFVLVASDGVWDAVSDWRAVQVVSSFLTKEQPQPELAIQALLDVVRCEQDDEFVDDATIMLVMLPPH